MTLRQIETFLGSAKFAVLIILVFAVLMAVGTFLESYYGTEFAGRALYKAPLFMGVQALMLLSVFYALLHRLPPKKGFYGFYTIHVGLILLFCGSFITWYAGIDGQIALEPNNPETTVSVGRDMLSIVEHDHKEVSYVLPYTAAPLTLNEAWKDFTLKRYLPFSENALEWKSSSDHFPSSRYSLFNDNVQQELIMTLHPKASVEFPATAQLGPLKVHYLSAALLPCFGRQNPDGLILYNPHTSTCSTPKERRIPLQKTTSGKTFLVVREEGQTYSFFPELSPRPLVLDEKRGWQPVNDSPLRIFSKKLFTQGPRLFLFGKGLAWYDKDTQTWQSRRFTEQNGKRSLVELPWMGFQIELLRHEEDKFPARVPHFQRPIQVNNKLIKGDQRALEIDVRGQSHWVTSQRPMRLALDGKQYSFYLGQQTFKLPFEINLTSFKMDTDPGTNNPASYESFVNLFSREGVSKHHIFMNNPLKFSHFTFYQASYFPTERGRYGSVLSVNFDPGRFWKYLGSALLVLGSIWHFYLRRKRSLS